MKNTLQCRICDVHTENIRKHLKDLHECELELAMVTEDVDDMSLWIRQCSIDRRQKISSKVENETLELNPVLNSTADEECPDEEAFAVNYQHSFLNETNFESFGGLEKSAMNVSETSAVGNIESPDDMAPNVNSNFCPPSMAVLFSHPNEPPQLECFGCNSNGSGGVGNLSSNTVFGSINTIAFDHRYTEQEIMEKEKTIVDDDGYPEYVTAGSTAIAANATQRIERLIAFNTDYISTAAKKATCRVCGQTDPNKHKHALRHMNVPDMFACSFCNMVHAWNRQVIIEHGKRKHKSNQALVSQEDKYSAGIAAAKMRCFPTPAQLAESLNSPNLTATTTHQPTFTTSFSSCNDVTLQNQSLVGSSATAKDVADWNSAGLPWSPNCYICGQATMKKLRHALRHLNQFDMFSCTLCSFSHPWNRQIVEHHMALRHDVGVELTSALVSSRLADFEVEISVMHRTCFKTDSIWNRGENGDFGGRNRRSLFSYSDSPLQAQSASTISMNGVQTEGVNVRLPIRYLTTGDRLGGMKRVRITGGPVGRPVRTVLTAPLKSQASSLTYSAASANAHDYIHHSYSTPVTARFDRLTPKTQ